jgi:nucleotide-binding universal stress UspA family protein
MSMQDMERIIWFSHARPSFRTTEGASRRFPVDSITPEDRLDSPAIVVPISFSGSWKTAVDVGINIAQTTHARLLFCHAISLPTNAFEPASPVWTANELREEARGKMEPLVDLAKKADVDAFYEIGEGTPAGVILKVAKKHAARLIVLSARERGAWARLLLGPTVGEQVAHEADCHVMIVRKPEATN